MPLNPCEGAKQSLRIREKHGDEPIDFVITSIIQIMFAYIR